MKFLCGSCRTKYQISDEKVRGKILTIRCKNCGSKVVVRESLRLEQFGEIPLAPVASEPPTGAFVGSDETEIGSDLESSLRHDTDVGPGEGLVFRRPAGSFSEEGELTSVAPVPQDRKQAGVEWYVAYEGLQEGPMAFAELVNRLRAGTVGTRHYVWHDGMSGWERTADVLDLIPYLDSPSTRPAPPPPPRRAPEEESGTLAVRSIVETMQEDTTVQAAAPTAEGALGSGIMVMTTTAGPTKATADSMFDEGDDLFANVPRASAAELVSAESTRFFVAAAGVNKQKSWANVARASAVTFGIVFVAFIGAWAGGIIELKLPGIGNPFAGFHAGKDEGEIELDNQDSEAIRHKLEGGKAAVPARGPRKPKPTAGGPAFYEDGRTGPGGTRTRDDQAETLGINFDRRGGPVLEKEDIHLPDVGGPNVPVPEQGTFSASAVGQVVQQNQKSVSLCYQKALGGNQALGGKLEILATIEPSGSVSSAVVDTAQFKGSRVGDCIADRILRWKFPGFDGEAQTVKIPFHLTKGY
jgi:predicted Zn finger-like uncharacterized protein